MQSKSGDRSVPLTSGSAEIQPCFAVVDHVKGVVDESDALWLERIAALHDGDLPLQDWYRFVLDRRIGSTLSTPGRQKRRKNQTIKANGGHATRTCGNYGV